MIRTDKKEIKQEPDVNIPEVVSSGITYQEALQATKRARLREQFLFVKQGSVYSGLNKKLG